MTGIVSGAGFPRDPKLYVERIPRESRFSFDVGRAVEAMRRGAVNEGTQRAG